MNGERRPKDHARVADQRFPKLADAELVTRSLGGEDAAFGALVERYRPLVFSIISARLSDIRDVEDEAQETFVLAFRRLHTLEAPPRFSPWSATIAANRAHTRLREDARRRAIPCAEMRTRDCPPDQAWGWRYTLPRLIAHEAVREAEARLPEEHRAMLRMRFIDDATYPDIAATFGAAPRAVEKRVARGLERLRTRVGVA